MLEGELSDPRIAPCHVTEVILAPGGKSCRVLVAVHGDETEEEQTLDGLMAARNYIRTEIRDRMGVRHVPELTFGIDRTEKLQARMDQVLENVQKRRQKLARKTATSKADSDAKATDRLS
jgi:ribosome-binding factor A